MTKINGKRAKKHRFVLLAASLKCKEKVQKKVFLKYDHLAQKTAQTGCFLQESRLITLHKYPFFVQKAT
ncbi:MAG: hypothetical protein IJ887_11835 [Prevotella sp.]|nr:hypothetical protein [Prevotella sp.]MBR3479909.1 hypothetical protein [Prevotella sp.]